MTELPACAVPPAARPSLLVVIPTYGAFDYAERAVRSVLQNSRVFRVRAVVIDDGSPDWQDAWAKRLRDELQEQFASIRFPDNAGLLRSWNHGIAAAEFNCFDYCCVTNSDVLFPIGWDVEILAGLETHALVGPVTNAPGSEPTQYVGRYSVLYDPERIEEGLQEVQDELLKAQAGRFYQATLNGFCLVAATATWTHHEFSPGKAFRPSNPVNSKGRTNPTPTMTLGEYELQKRWHANGLTSAVCLGSYVLHYRSVSRGPRHCKGDWLRAGEHQA